MDELNEQLPTICWIADVRGWAYDNRAQAIGGQLSQFNHVIVYDPVRNLGECLTALFAADIIVCPDPRLYIYLPCLDKMIQHINAIKIFG